MSTPSLEKRIAAALSSDATSADLATLIADTEAAIAAADAAAEAERTKALDPALSPDAKAAREAMQATEFARDRLRTVLPRLQAGLTEVEAVEYAARWEPDFRQIETQRDELATEYAQLYPKVVSQLVDLFRRVEAVDQEVSRINGSAPYGERRRLLGVELAARSLENFSTADPSIARGVQLPDFERSEMMAWPPRTTPLALLVASPASGDSRRYSDKWWQVKEEEARAQRERQERESAEREAKARADWHGPRWWEGERA